MPSSQRRTLLKPTVCLLLMRRCTSRPQPSQTQHAINEWRGHPDGQADVMGNCQQCVKLDRIVPFHILQHGHLERAESPDHSDHFLNGSTGRRARLHTKRRAYPCCLFHHRNTKPTDQWVVYDTIGGRRGQQTDWVHAKIAPQFEPDVVLDIGTLPGIEIGAPKPVGETCQPRRWPVVRLADQKLAADDAWLVNGGGNDRGRTKTFADGF